MSENTAAVKQEIEALRRQLATMKRDGDSLRSELSETKGNLSAFEKEREKLFARAKEKNADPKNIGKDIAIRVESLKTEAEAARRKLDAIKTSAPEDSEEGW